MRFSSWLRGKWSKPAATAVCVVNRLPARVAASATSNGWPLSSSTFAFTVCFMVWMMFGVIGIPLKQALELNATEFGLLMATPVLTGSLIRLPLGIWTDRYGGRIVMTLLMVATVPAAGANALIQRTLQIAPLVELGVEVPPLEEVIARVFREGRPEASG